MIQQWFEMESASAQSEDAGGLLTDFESRKVPSP